MYDWYAQNRSFAVVLGGLISDSVLKIHCYLKQNPRRRKLIRRETVLGFSGGQGDPGSDGLKLHMCSRPAGHCLQTHWTAGATDCWGLHPPPGGKTFWPPLYNIFTPGASSTSEMIIPPTKTKRVVRTLWGGWGRNRRIVYVQLIVCACAQDRDWAGE